MRRWPHRQKEKSPCGADAAHESRNLRQSQAKNASMLTCRVSPRLLLPQDTYRMVAYYARFVKSKTKKAKRACKNAADGVQYGMFRIRPWRNWISQWIPIPKAGGSSPSGRAKKQDVAFAASCFFSPRGREPPRNFAKQNAALFREGVRNRRRRQQRESAVRVPPEEGAAKGRRLLQRNPPFGRNKSPSAMKSPAGMKSASTAEGWISFHPRQRISSLREQGFHFLLIPFVK